MRVPSQDASGAAPLRRPPGAGADFEDYRRILHEGCAGAVVEVSRSAPNAPSGACCPDWEIALPLAGVFRWQVGRSVSLVDPNSALFIREGQEFSEEHPIEDRGHRAVVVIPAASLFDELCGGKRPGAIAHFRTSVRAASPRAQLIARQLACLGDPNGSLEGDELAVGFVDEVLKEESRAEVQAPPRLVARAKEFLHERPEERFSLADAAEEIGVTPIYLTQAFKKSEGAPLYRYQMRLRLARALNELPHCESITGLAFDLGFSSHSHFTAAFTATYSLTPSAFRESARSLLSRASLRSD